MSDRQAIEDLLEELYAARVRGDLETITRLFAANATFQVAGTDNASPMPTLVKGNAGIASLMQGMITNFEVSDFTMLIDGPSAAVRWQATFHVHQDRADIPHRACRLYHRRGRQGRLLHRVSRHRACRQGFGRQITTFCAP